MVEVWCKYFKYMFIFRFYLDSFVIEVCFLFFVVYWGVIVEEYELGTRVTFYVSTFKS
jgi:hypothetical protein